MSSHPSIYKSIHQSSHAMARLAMLALASCGLLLRATPEPTAPACSYARITHSDDKVSAVTHCWRLSERARTMHA